MMKHAFLVVAHHQFEILGKMMSLLDDERCDFFIHIDKKTQDSPNDYLQSCCKRSKVFFVDRIPIYWGGYSQIQCTINLLRNAIPLKYDYYHLISGVDFPIKTKEQIYTFFEQHNTCQFIHFERLIIQEKYKDRLRYHSVFQDTNSRFLKTVDRGIRQIERIIKFDRLKYSNIQFQYGWNWFSITHDFADWVLQQEKWIYKVFRNTICGDELFIQTMLINSPYRDQVTPEAYDNDCNSCLRSIDWKRGKPYVYRMQDMGELQRSSCLFARKFDLEVDSRVIDALYQQLSE